MRKFLTCAALLWLAAARAAGQASADEDAPHALHTVVRLGDAGAEAGRLLRSGDTRERAWGAYLAGLHGLNDEAPRLVEMLADPALAGGGWQEARALQAALDALIRLDAEVPAETLLPLRQSSPDEVFILLAREPRQNRQALLSLFADEAPDPRWLAAGNLLAETRAPGFAARLLAGLKIEARVYVYDSEGDHGYNGGGGCGSGGGGRVFRSPDGYPPVFYYFLTTANARGAVVAAPGRRTVYYGRSTSPSGGEYGCGLPRDEYRVGYVAELLGTTREFLKLEARPSREVVCRDAPQCGRALAAVRDEIVGAYAEALRQLLDAGLLDAAEAAESKPDITLRLHDSRERTRFPLPSKLKGVKVEVYGAEAETPADPAEPSTEEPAEGESVACGAGLPSARLCAPPVP